MHININIFKWKNVPGGVTKPAEDVSQLNTPCIMHDITGYSIHTIKDSSLYNQIRLDFKNV